MRSRLDQLIDCASWVTRRVQALPPSGGGRPRPEGAENP